MSTKVSDIRALTILALAYFLLAAAALELTRLSDGVALMWPANAVLVLALVSRAPRRWIAPAAIACGASIAATLTAGPAVFAAPLFAAVNIGEASIAALLLRRFHRRDQLLDSMRSVIVFVAAAGVAAPAIGGIGGALIGMGALDRPFFGTWADWAAGHGLGMLIAAPVALVVARGEISAWWHGSSRRQAATGVGLLALVAIVTGIIFSQGAQPILFVTVVPVLIVSFALGRPGASMALLIVAVVGGFYTIAGYGPIASLHGDEAFQFQFFEFYLGVLFLIALPVAASLSERQRLFAAVRQNEASLRVLTENSTDILLSLDTEGYIRFASAAARNLGGFDPDSLVGRHALELIEPDHHEAIRAVHLDALANPDRNFTAEYRATRADGSAAWFETNMRAVRGADGSVTGAVSAIRDVSHRKTFESRLIQQATTDPLTGVLNRRAFTESLAAAIADPRPATLAILDIDHFKQVNDRFGHAMGDTALVMLAECCRSALRGSDVVARLGGEEFAVLLDGADMKEAAPVCERLRKAIESRVVGVTPRGPLRITASFGLADLPPGGNADAALAAADQALYEAKTAGRNCLRIAA